MRDDDGPSRFEQECFKHHHYGSITGGSALLVLLIIGRLWHMQLIGPIFCPLRVEMSL